MNHINSNRNMSQIVFVAFAVMLSIGPTLRAVELPEELPLWEKVPGDYAIGQDIKEQVRSYKVRPGAPSGSNRVFSFVSSPTYSIHRPQNPNGVGLIICPGGGFKDVWIDREGHDLAIWLKRHGVTCLVLKYRTRPTELSGPNAWRDYQRAVCADGWQAIRILRTQASELGLNSDKIGICGFSAGGHLAISCSLGSKPKRPADQVNSRPDFAGLFYPGIPEDITEMIAAHTDSEDGTSDICPMFIINSRVDELTPVDKCLDFYAMLLKVAVEAELHVFSKGSHGFDMGDGRGESMAIWPKSFVAWLKDSNIIEE